MAIDLDAYFARIGIAAPRGDAAAALAAVQRAHRLSIPFENLDIHLGRGISLDPGDVFDKLVRRRRGGYCFEQNQLFLRALHAMGFAARPLLARVWLLAEGTPPRTHTLNLVTVGDAGWIADAGFGGSYTPPMPLAEHETAPDPGGARHRLRRDAEHGWMLEREAGGGWTPQYSFAADPVWPQDLELANHWTSSRPGTRFTTLRTVGIVTTGGHAFLTDRRLAAHEAGRTEESEVGSAADYGAILAARFGLSLTPAEIARLGLYA